MLTTTEQKISDLTAKVNYLIKLVENLQNDIINAKYGIIKEIIKK